jgi:hypothetical protein
VPMLMMMSREVRRVPLDYEAPRSERHGSWQPRFDKFYVPTVKQWLADREAWENGTHPDRAGHDYSFEEWDGNGPDPDYYYPGEGWPEDAEMGIQMYETVTEGTPISRVYPDTPGGRRAMAEELTTIDSGITSGLTVDQWLQIIDGQTLARDIHTGEVR